MTGRGSIYALMAENSSPSAILNDQRLMVTDGLLRKKEKGDVWYLVSIAWYQLWSRYVGLDPNIPAGLNEFYPGPIDNSSITDGKGCLLPNMTELTFMALPNYCWNNLSRYYKICGKSPHPLARTVVADSNNNAVIDLYPLEILVCQMGEQDSVNLCWQTLSRYATIEQVFEKAHHGGRDWIGALASSIKQKYIHAWLKLKDSNQISELQHAKLSSVTLEKLNVCDGSLLILHRSNDLTPPSLKLVMSVFRALGSSLELEGVSAKQNAPLANLNELESVQTSKSCVPGICGLDNLGNTCFMNSVIQFLSNVPELRDFFTNSLYKSAVDREANKGELADTFAALMRSMWSGYNDTATPRDFPDAFLKLEPQFSNGQHDAHNFLEYLLHCLREELSKSNTPASYLLPETSKSAKEHWNWYRDKSRSIISDLFDGQLQSTVCCEVCGETAVNFEPFTCLSLPIPTRRQIPAYFRFANPNKPVSLMHVKIPRRCKVRDIRTVIAETTGVKADKFKIAGMTMEYRFTRWYSDEDVPPFGDREIVMCFEVDETVIPIDDQVRVVAYLSSGRDALHGFPYLLVVSREQVTEMRLNQMIYQRVEPLFSFHNDIPQEGFHYWLLMADADLASKQQLHGTGQYVFRNDLARAKTKCLIMMWDSRNYELFFKARSLEAVIADPGSGVEKDVVSLQQCFDSFLEEEHLSGSDAWRCPKCKEPRNASKKMEITMRPLYLMIHLNRFLQDDWGFNKLETFVKYPMSLDPDSQYELFAVVTHYGDMNSGHYKAMVHHLPTKKWFEFDDRYVSELSIYDRVINDAAFILIYRRK